MFHWGDAATLGHVDRSADIGHHGVLRRPILADVAVDDLAADDLAAGPLPDDDSNPHQPRDPDTDRPRSTGGRTAGRVTCASTRHL